MQMLFDGDLHLKVVPVHFVMFKAPSSPMKIVSSGRMPISPQVSPALPFARMGTRKRSSRPREEARTPAAAHDGGGSGAGRLHGRGRLRPRVMRLVLDANVLIAAFVARGVCAELLEYCVREHEPVTSVAILEEVRRNLVARIKVTVAQADQTVKLLRTRLDVVAPLALGAQVCRDPDHDVVLGTAVAGRCDAIVTGDKDLLVLERYHGVEIVSPRAFWSFESQRSSGG